MPLFKHPILNHRNLYLLGMACILFSMPISPFGISLGTFILAGNWILEGDFPNKWKRLKANAPLFFFASLFLLWIAGLWNSENLPYALHDLKIKVPILVLPILIGSTKKLEDREYRLLTYVFIFALWIAVLFGIMKLTGIGMTPATDTRELGVFVSHIRLALMTGTGIIMAFDVMTRIHEKKHRILMILSVCCFYIFLIILHTFTALFVIVLLSLFVPLYYIVRLKKGMLKYFLSILMITLVLLGIDWIVKSNTRFYTVTPINPGNLDSLTVNGNTYRHYLTLKDWENGHYTWIYVCEKELRKEWNGMSSRDYDGKDRNGNDIRFTLIRYLTSKGLRKDSVGIHQLSEKDIAAIESGIANELYNQPYSLYALYYKWLWELNNYRLTGNPSGHSLVQRLIYQKTGWQIAKDHLFTGIGTGDVQDVFNRYYTLSMSPIAEKWRLRAHNQYLTALITFGIFGFSWFIFGFFYPWIKGKNRDLVITGFILLAAISMLWEDTLETQAGVYFIAFFYVFLIFARKPNREKAGHDN